MLRPNIILDCGFWILDWGKEINAFGISDHEIGRSDSKMDRALFYALCALH